ncbi:serine/threonine phosphatase [Lyngbya sp. PCC 8106]|uniref:serine/threonine phosphatase n=1 Tax=Lyngbya sp. (strain PCC 8106) TaxID=313612 RepID=UPI0000EAD1B8|nr:serine/threonine phosphatase [Lyngbya sp. PCC 8106]EAW38316.1 Protein serine/threonine phosphatase [Lyngbya sp. PCC 8106]
MLVCPQCLFENPSHHKFCQKCGYSLTQRVCGECGSTVSLSVLDCPDCGTRTGTVWLAVVSRLPVECEHDILDRVENPSSSPERDRLGGAIAEISEETQTQTDKIQAAWVKSEPELTPDQMASLSENGVEIDSVASDQIWGSEAFDASEIPVCDALDPDASDDSNDSVELKSDASCLPGLDKGMYLDENQRYQLIEPLETLKPDETVTVEVLDTQPLEMSPLEAAQLNLLSSSEKMDTFVIAAAQAYFILQSQFQNHFPKLKDAWKSDLYTVVLLENYSNFPMLLEKFKDSQTTPQQILSGFQQMADLWEPLEEFQCRQSLLELTNILVSPTFPHEICLQKLYRDFRADTVSLSDLGKAWKTLIQQSQRTLFGSLTQLLRDLNEGEIKTITQLQNQLAEVEQELNSSSTETPVIPISSPTRIQEDVDDDITDVPTGGSVAPTIPRLSQLLHLEAVGATDIGRRRQRNEDSFGVQTTIHEQQTPQGRVVEAKGLYILCDGMGGHASGEVASQLAVDTLKQYFQSQLTGELPTSEMIKNAIIQANTTIYEANQEAVRSGVGRMGTTLVMAIVAENQVAIAHVGDSRLYRLTSRGIEQITVDHEVGQREIQRGVSPDVAYARPDAYQLTQALGPRDRNFVKPDIQFLEVQEDTVFILASDGLTDNDLLEIYYATHLDPLLNPKTDLDAGVNQLIELANEHNGHDNITIIAIRMLVSPSRK